MNKFFLRLMIAILTAALAIWAVGCQRQEKAREGEKGVNIQIDTGKAKVKVEGSRTPDEKGTRLDVDVDRPSRPGRESDRHEK